MGRDTATCYTWLASDCARKKEDELKALVNAVDIFNKDISMKFGISRCAKVIVYRGKFEPAQGTPTSMDNITDLETDKGYKYLEVLQTNENMQDKIKIKRNKHTSKELNKY